MRVAEALWRPGRGRHNVWEIVLHTAYWKYIVRRRLLRDPELSFPRPGSNWFALPPRPDERAWRRDVALLKQEHRLLRAVIARFPQLEPLVGAIRWKGGSTAGLEFARRMHPAVLDALVNRLP